VKHYGGPSAARKARARYNARLSATLRGAGLVEERRQLARLNAQVDALFAEIERVRR
jgi:hypothetical protein